MTVDEGIRWDTSLEKLGSLKPAFKTDGVITAGNSSQISDGSAAVLIMSEDKAAELGMRPRARFVSFALAGVDRLLLPGVGRCRATKRPSGRGPMSTAAPSPSVTRSDAAVPSSSPPWYTS